jgi:hypothetical protein
MDSNRLVVLRAYPQRIHAELAKSALDAREIDSMIRGDANIYSGKLPGGVVELIVNAKDVERANEVLGPDESFSN